MMSNSRNRASGHERDYAISDAAEIIGASGAARHWGSFASIATRRRSTIVTRCCSCFARTGWRTLCLISAILIVSLLSARFEPSAESEARYAMNHFVDDDQLTELHRLSHAGPLKSTDFLARHRCSGLAWSAGGWMDAQFATWQQALGRKPLTNAELAAAWLQRPSLCRMQVIRGRVYFVPRPLRPGDDSDDRPRTAGVQDCADFLRLRMVAAALTRALRHAVLPDVDLLLETLDDPGAAHASAAPPGHPDDGHHGHASGAAVSINRVPLFALNRFRGASDLLVPWSIGPHAPFWLPETASLERSGRSRTGTTAITERKAAEASLRSGSGKVQEAGFSQSGDAMADWEHGKTARSKRWQRRRNAAVFRGSDTGSCHADQPCFLKDSARGRVCVWMRDNAALAASALDFSLALPANAHSDVMAACPHSSPSMSLSDQTRLFNFVLHLDGNSHSARLGDLLQRDWAVLRVASPFESMLDAIFTPGVHFVPVREDLGDLADALMGLRANTSAAMNIAARATAAALAHLNADAQSCYWVELLLRYSSVTGMPRTLPLHRRAVPALADASWWTWLSNLAARWGP